jgi:hypothetical protein
LAYDPDVAETDDVHRALDRWQRVKEVLRPVAGVQEIQVVGALSDTVARQIGLPTSIRTVLIHPDVVQHILEQRKGGADDAEIVFQHMADAIAHPHFCGPDPRQPHRYDLAYFVPPDELRPMIVAIKFVPSVAATTQLDELWVSTAYRLSARFRERIRWQQSLRPTSADNL